MKDLAGKIRYGIAGWSYPDWRGYVYDESTRDTLRFVAGYVDLVEINTTFYRPPRRVDVESWLRRTGDLRDFSFSAKLHQDVTHRGVIEPGLVKAFHDAFEPARDAGKLSHLLAQFRYDFRDGPGPRRHLLDIRGCFGDIAELVLELRHVSWQSEEALAFLSGIGVTVANLDYPVGRDSFALPVCGIGSNAYFRLHGRNSKAWFAKDAGRDETYNYLYSKAELEGIALRAVRIVEMSKSLTLVANNHYQGKELANLLQLKALLGGEKVKAPGLLRERYPELRDVSLPVAGTLLLPGIPERLA